MSGGARGRGCGPLLAPGVQGREVAAWAMFDFANSSFTTIMVTVIFPVYFVETLCAGRGDGERLWGLAGAVSNLLVVALSPLLGAMADVWGAKKRFLMGTWLGCVAGTAMLGFVPAGWAAAAVGLFVFANLCFALGENFCAGFLPELSTPESAGRVSALGWSVGYFGGLLSLLIARAFSGGGAAVVTAAFFLVAGLPTFLFLRERKRPEARPQAGGFFRFAFGPLLRTLGELPRHRDLFVFFASFFLFMGGLSTVVYFAGVFASRELGMGRGELAVMFLFLQMSAAAGAFGFGWLQDWMGSKGALSLGLLVWVGVVVGCYLTHDVPVFFGVAAFAGVAMGAVQSCARALVSRLTPPEKAGEFFGLWGFFGKLAAVAALAGFGDLAARFGLRPALLGTLALFALGWLVLLAVREERQEGGA